VIERQLYTFTKKLGGNKLVPIHPGHLAKSPIKTYSRKSNPCKNKTKKKTKAFNSINTIVKTTNRIHQECTSYKNETPALTSAAVPVPTVEIPILAHDSYSINLQQSSTSQTPDSIDNTSVMFFISSYSDEDNVNHHTMETEETVTINNVPVLQVPEVNPHLYPEMVTGDIAVDVVDSSFDPKKGQDWFTDLLNTFTSKKLATSKEQPTTNKDSKRHKKGPKRQNLEDLPAENRDNVKRCRVYRKTKKEKQVEEAKELKILETKNKELRQEEQRMSDELIRMQGAYLKLIREGRIKSLDSSVFFN